MFTIKTNDIARRISTYYEQLNTSSKVSEKKNELSDIALLCKVSESGFLTKNAKAANNSKSTITFLDESGENSIEKIIALVNENAKKDEEKTETFQAKDWFNNKKLLRALEKVANCNFEKLKTALNSNEDIRDNKFLKELELTSGDLSVLDAIDGLYDTKRAKEKFNAADQNVARKNLEMMMRLIPKDKTTQVEFFKLTKEENFELKITPQNIIASTARPQPFLQKINETTRK